MKLCDRCGQKEEKHREVGPLGVKVQIEGYHHRHHTHPDAPWQWSIDLCPACAKMLKYEIDALLKEYKKVK